MLKNAYYFMLISGLNLESHILDADWSHSLAGFGLPGFLSPKIWWYPSAIQDYVLFMLLNALKLSLLAALLPEINQFIWWGIQLWQEIFGYQERQQTGLWVNISFTISLFVASDFSRYWLLRWMHTNPWLWRIHRLHYSAQILKPNTFYLIHPLESLLFGLRYALMAGFVTNLYMHWFGFGMHAHYWLGSLAIVALANMLGSNLRHSQLPLSYWPWLQTWLISPAQHQWQHTIDGNQRNFGSILALWGHLFGSLDNTRSNASFRFGISDQKISSLLKQLLLR